MLSTKSIKFENVVLPERETVRVLFQGFDNVEIIDCSGMDFSKMYDLTGMFADAKKLTKIIWPNIDASEIKYFAEMFFNCESLEELDLSMIKFNDIYDTRYMFSGCKKLKKLTFPKYRTMTSAEGSKNMFFNCNSLKEIVCTLDFKNFCMENATNIALPFEMREDNSGTWTIID